MGFISGESAAVDGFTCLKDFKIFSAGFSDDLICTATPGGVIGVVGNDDWKGEATGYGASPAKYPGQTFTFTGVLSNGTGRTGASIVEVTTMRWEVGAGLPMEYDIEFPGNGALSEVSGSEVTDAGAPSGLSAKSMGLRIDNVLNNVRRMKLRVECRNAKYNDTGTAGHTTRGRGTYHAQFEVEMYYNDPAALPAEHTFKELIFQTEAGADATVGWKLNYGLIDLVKDDIPVYSKDGRAQGVYALIRGRWSAYSGAVKGYIKMPDTTTLWPIP